MREEGGCSRAYQESQSRYVLHSGIKARKSKFKDYQITLGLRFL